MCVLKIGLILQRGRGSSAEMVNGVLLYVSYLVCHLVTVTVTATIRELPDLPHGGWQISRVLSLPLWLALYAHDLYTTPELTWAHPGPSGPLIL